MKRLTHLLAAALSLVLLAPLRAQNTFDKMVYCVGTSTQSGADRWAYVLFQPVQLNLLDGNALAVYQQNGSVGTFQLKSVTTGAVTDPSVIKPLIARAAALGENVAELNAAVTTMFQDLVPDASIPLERKLSAIIQGSLNAPEKRKSLFLLARQHPAMALALGQAVAVKLPGAGNYTFEVRNRGAVATAAAAAGNESVIGRVTVDTAAPLVLPAPGKPFNVVDTSAKGNLHAQLRWPTPDGLRQVSLSQYGFNVYRMAPAFVTTRNYHVTPPNRTQLAADIAAGQAARINVMPVLADRDYDAVSVADTANTSFFISDDNRQFEAGGTSFADGANFWYFVTARDILGRDGLVSPGLQVSMCDRIAPLPPTDLKVSNETSFATVGGSKQWLRLKWKTPEANDASGVLKYYVYRWSNIDQIAVNQRTLLPAPTVENPTPNPNLIATVNHTAGVTEYTLDDTGLPGSPVQPANNGISFWYTVRAVDNSSCQNVSGNSAPEFGVLRDREGPPAAQGDVLVCCYAPSLTFRNGIVTTNAAADQSRTAMHIELVAEAAGIGINEQCTAEFQIGGLYLGQVPFKLENGAPALRARLHYDQPETTSTSLREVQCSVRTASGKKSPIVYSSGVFTTTNNVTQTVTVTFDATTNAVCQPASTSNDCGNKHESVDPASSEPNLPQVTFIPPPGSREYKLYRRIDNGPLTLVKQGTYAAGAIDPAIIKDDAPPATPGTICYFVQCFDEQGNASPMAALGCIENCGKLPTPMLGGLEGTGNSASPKVKVKWFCPPAGVTRFEILLHRVSGSYALGGAGLSTDKAQHPNYQLFDGTAQQFDFSVFETASLESQGAATAGHSVELPCSAGDVQQVMIRAVGPGTYGSRCVGALSNGEEFSWTGSVASNAVDVPWPARPIPPQDAAFIQGLIPEWINAPGRPSLAAGVRIGHYTVDDRAWDLVPSLGANSEVQQTVMHASGSPSAYLYKNNEAAANEKGKYAGTLLPYALFRYQVANAKFPVVSGDVVQVSPLMEEIAYQTTTYPSGATNVPAHIIKDPFIVGIPKEVLPSGKLGAYLYALDRQPPVRGAEYKYLFVRFKERTKEIDRVVPAQGSVTIP